MISRTGKIILFIASIMLIYIYCHLRSEIKELREAIRTQSVDDRRRWNMSASAADRTDAGRPPNDGHWYDFSDVPSLLFYAYSAFVDQRVTSPEHGNLTCDIICLSSTSFSSLLLSLSLNEIFHMMQSQKNTKITEVLF